MHRSGAFPRCRAEPWVRRSGPPPSPIDRTQEFDFGGPLPAKSPTNEHERKRTNRPSCSRPIEFLMGCRDPARTETPRLCSKKSALFVGRRPATSSAAELCAQSESSRIIFVHHCGMLVGRDFIQLTKHARQELAVSFTEIRRRSRTAPDHTCPTARNFDMRVKRLTVNHFCSSMWHSADHPKRSNRCHNPQACRSAFA